MSLRSHEPSERRETLAAPTKMRFKRLAGVVSRHALPERELVTLEKQPSLQDSNRLSRLEKAFFDQTCTPRLPAAAEDSSAQANPQKRLRRELGEGDSHH